jgi:hypothetical protein
MISKFAYVFGYTVFVLFGIGLFFGLIALFTIDLTAFFITSISMVLTIAILLIIDHYIMLSKEK